MTNTAFLFPGQGSQFVGMGKEFFDNFQVSRNVLAEIDKTLGINLSKIISEGPVEELTKTENTQPAIMAVSIAILSAITETKGPISKMASFVAGHSLGEYSALCAAGAISLADTARLLQIRGRSMQDAVPLGKGSMAAVLGLSMNELEDLIRNEMASDIIDIANDNCPGQIVVSGTTDSIDKIIALLSNIGKRAVKLQVSAPFHSRLMEPVKEIMAESLAQTKINQAIIPVIANVTARDEIDPRKIAQNLALQVSARVRWTETVEYLISQNITKFVEIGPGQVLSGLMKRINRDVQIVSINSIADMDLI